MHFILSTHWKQTWKKAIVTDISYCVWLFYISVNDSSKAKPSSLKCSSTTKFNSFHPNTCMTTTWTKTQPASQIWIFDLRQYKSENSGHRRSAQSCTSTQSDDNNKQLLFASRETFCWCYTKKKQSTQLGLCVKMILTDILHLKPKVYDTLIIWYQPNYLQVSSWMVFIVPKS